MKKIQENTLVILFVISTLWVDACTYESIVDDTDCIAALTISLTSLTEASCNESNGGFELAAEGGQPPYAFSVNGGSPTTEAVFSNIAAGIYQVVATDRNGCTSEITEISVRNKDGLNVAVAVTDPACGVANGQIKLEIQGGVAPYQFTLNGGNPQTQDQFTNLAAGSYVVTCRDASGCELSQTVQLKESVDFSIVKNLVNTNCAVSNCHNGTISPDLRENATIQARAARIKARTSAKTMPPVSSGRSLSDAEIQQITCWVDGGASIGN